MQVVEGVAGLVGDLEPGVELELVEQLRKEFAVLLLLAVEGRQRAADDQFAGNRASDGNVSNGQKVFFGGQIGACVASYCTAKHLFFLKENQ